MPLVRPVTLAEVPVTVVLLPAGLELTVYEVIALPPFDAGAVQETAADALPAVALTAVGAPGTLAGVTLLEAAEAALEPIALWATTEKV